MLPLSPDRQLSLTEDSIGSARQLSQRAVQGFAYLSLQINRSDYGPHRAHS